MLHFLQHQVKVAQSVVGMFILGAKGTMGTANPKQPTLPITLYDCESEANCRLVRQVLTTLNLNVTILPCPQGGNVFINQLKQSTGQTQTPTLVDENSQCTLSNTQDIIDHLFKQYGNTGKTPSAWQNAVGSNAIECTLSNALSFNRGTNVSKYKAAPAKLLQLWSFETSPYSRLVRERLCELELPYILHNVAKERWQDIGPAVLRLKPGKYEPVANGKREKELASMAGKMQVPFLLDENTSTALYESQAILAYLNKTYG